MAVRSGLILEAFTDRARISLGNFRLAMPDHLSQIRIMLALVFGADICERLLQRATLGEDFVYECGHLNHES